MLGNEANSFVMSASALTPILRLYPDVWSEVSSHLQENDVLRLFACGNRSFSSNLRCGVKTVSLRWKLDSYIDLYRIFLPLNGFNYENLILKPHFEGQLAWSSSLAVGMWPRNLKRLDLDFFGSLSQVLPLGPLSERWPSLLVLNLRDSTNYNRSQTPTHVSLAHLPTGLLELRLISCRSISFDPLDLETLPRNLRTLWLEVSLHCGEEEKSPMQEVLHHGGQVPTIRLPKLPDTVTELALKGDQNGGWDVRDFPSNLVTFHLFGSGKHFAQIRLGVYSRFDLQSMESLQDLRTVDMRKSLLSASDLDHIPESVTTLNCFLTRENERCPPHILKMLKNVGGFSSFLNFRTRAEAPTLPSIVSMNCFINAEALLKLPPTLTQLRLQIAHGCYLPESLTSLHCYALDASPRDGDHEEGFPWFLPPRLKRLRISSNIEASASAEIVEALPSSIEELEMAFGSEAWALLNSRSGAGHLPNLRRLNSAKMTTEPLWIAFPSTVRRLKLRVDLPTGAAPSFDVLRESQLERISIEIPQRSQSNALYHELIANLPLTCTVLKLHFSGIALDSPRWPPNLQKLVYRSTECDWLLNAAQTLPRSLRSLATTKTRFLACTDAKLESFPPYLHNLTTNHGITHIAYFEYRQGPPGTDRVKLSGRKLSRLSGLCYD